MTRFTKPVVVTCLLSLMASTDRGHFWLKASEPQDNSIVAGKEADTLQPVSAVDERWDEVNIPVSALRPSIGPSRIGADGSEINDPRVLVRNRTEVFSRFHAEYFSRLGPAEWSYICRGDSTANWPDTWMTLDYTNWYLFEGFNGLLFVPKGYLFSNDVHSTQAEVLSNNSWDARSPCIDEALIDNGFDQTTIKTEAAGLNGNLKHSQQAGNRVDSLFEPFMNGSRTEWKLIRREIVGFTKLASLTCDTGFRTFRANDPERDTSSGPDSFELQALSRLQFSIPGSVVYSETEDEIRIVGALGRYYAMGGHGGQFLAMSYRFARVVESTASRRKYPLETGRSVSRVIARRRNEACAKFHSRFETQFALIVKGFGNSRMWIDDPRRIQHGLHGTAMTWYMGQSGEGFSIEPTRLNSDVSETNAYPDTALNDFQMFVDVTQPDSLIRNRIPTFSGQLIASSGFVSVLRNQSSSLLWIDFNDASISMQEWRLERLELIGLLKHPAPVVYTGNHTSKIDELEGVPTVPLNAFEQTAVRRLKSNWSENVVVNETSDEIQIVGGLRASNSCIACHKVESGQLLGALTYRLTRVVRDSQGAQTSHQLIREVRKGGGAVGKSFTDVNAPASALTPENEFGDIWRAEPRTTLPAY